MKGKYTLAPHAPVNIPGYIIGCTVTQNRYTEDIHI